jgi:hydroxymethylpyrimidine/phosphomethylpyrimidine kinase
LRGESREIMKGRVLIIAGSDPSGGAGIQADIKTVTALGGYAAAAITALTVQNTKGVTAVQGVGPAFIRAQIEAVMSDIGADAIKIGMIGDAETANLLADILKDYAGRIPIVLDPVLAATSGDALAGEGVAGVIREKLAGLSSVITPNTEEASALTGVAVKDEASMKKAGEDLIGLGAKAALMKGGHLSGEEIADLLVTVEGVKRFHKDRIKTTSTHGTGCTLASAVATGLAQGMALEAAVERAIDYVHKAIETAPGYGAGSGPLNHGHTIKKS